MYFLKDTTFVDEELDIGYFKKKKKNAVMRGASYSQIFHHKPCYT